MSKTVRNIAEEVAGPLSALGACTEEPKRGDECIWERIVWNLQEAGILDAIVYDEPDAAVLVITKELREWAISKVANILKPFVTAKGENTVAPGTQKVMRVMAAYQTGERIVDTILSTVLRKTRVAKEIQTVIVPPNTFCVQVPIYTSPTQNHDRCYTIATLEEEK